MLQGRLGGVPRDQWSFKLSVKCVSRKFQLKVSRVFQKCFKEVFFCNFVLACISSQLPEQKEGLFYFFGGVGDGVGGGEVFFSFSLVQPHSALFNPIT